MAGEDARKKSIETVVSIVSAVKNIRLYPPGSNLVKNSVARVHEAMAEAFESEGAVEFAETEKNLIINGCPLDEKDQKKPQIIEFIDLLNNLSVKSIRFEAGLDSGELETFLTMICQKPADLIASGELDKIKTDNLLPHILLDRRVYVTVDHGSGESAGDKGSDNQMVDLLLGNLKASGTDLAVLKQKASDPAWLSGLIKAGLENIDVQRAALQEAQISEKLANLIQNLDEMTTDEAKVHVTAQLVKALSNIDEAFLKLVSQQNLKGSVGEGLYDFINGKMVDRRSGEKRRKIADSAQVAARHGERRSRQDRRKSQADQFKEGLTSILKGEQDVFADPDTMRLLPNAVDHFFAKGKRQTGEALVDKLIDGLIADDPESKANVAKALAEIGEKLLSDNRIDEMIRLSRRLNLWIKFEATMSETYQSICRQLGELAVLLIKSAMLAESEQILETFHMIHVGMLKKSGEVKSNAENILESIAAEDIVDLLLRELHTNEKGNKEKAFQNLRKLSTFILERLLDDLMKNEDMYARVRIVRLISEMGADARKAVIERIEQSDLWYYKRNLISILGKIGKAEDIDKLKTYLGGEDLRVQREALGSIIKIGSGEKGEILLSLLEAVHDSLKINIVTMLGSLKYGNAVPKLLDMLETKTSTDSKLEEKLKVKICTALGQIGSQEAIPALVAIIEKKGFMKLKPYHKRIAAAAAEALAKIEKQ